MLRPPNRWAIRFFAKPLAMAQSICARLGWLHTVHFDPCIFSDRRRGITYELPLQHRGTRAHNMRSPRSNSSNVADTPATPEGEIRENARVSAAIAALCVRSSI